MKGEVSKKLGKELLKYRKRQYIILKILIALLTFFESCILVITYNESYILSNGEDFEIAIIGVCVLIFLFLLTYYSIVYVNLYIERKNFYSLFLIGFLEKDVINAMKYFGKRAAIGYVLAGSVLGIGLGTLLTWQYKQTFGVFLAVGLSIIIYVTSQIVLKKCVKRIWRLKDAKIKQRKEKRITSLKTLNLRKISFKYIIYNKKRVLKMDVLIFISGLVLTFAITMIQSISLEKYIRDTWGDSNYKIILNEKGNTSGDYYHLQIDNPLTGELMQDITEIEGVNDVIPNYSIQAVIELEKEKVETRIRKISDEILKERNINGLQDEVIISVQSDYFEKIKNQIHNDTILVSYFDGNEKKTINFEVKEVFIDNTKATRIYASEECIKDMVSQSSPIHAFYVYGQENDKIQLEIEKLINGQNLELQCKNDFIIEAEKSFNVICVGIISIMVILMMFSTSVLINSKLINLMVQEQDFEILQNIGMTNSNIKHIIAIEELVSSSVTSIFAYILGMALSYFACYKLEMIGSTFWEFRFNIISLLAIVLLLASLTFIEIKFYNRIMINNNKIKR